MWCVLRNGPPNPRLIHDDTSWPNGIFFGGRVRLCREFRGMNPGQSLLSTFKPLKLMRPNRNTPLCPFSLLSSTIYLVALGGPWSGPDHH
jgi:hypothetical protein